MFVDDKSYSASWFSSQNSGSSNSGAQIIEMSPPGVLVDTFRHDYRVGDDADLDDLPAGKVKLSLRQQYKKLDGPAVALGANIDWVPSMANYLERVARRLKQGIPAVTLPPGFPESVSGPACWSADEINSTKLFRTLSDAQILEIETALAHFKGLYLHA